MRLFGEITSLDCAKGTGFILSNRETFYFDKRSLVDVEFDPLLIGREVSFTPAAMDHQKRRRIAHQIRGYRLRATGGKFGPALR